MEFSFSILCHVWLAVCGRGRVGSSTNPRCGCRMDASAWRYSLLGACTEPELTEQDGTRTVLHAIPLYDTHRRKGILYAAAQHSIFRPAERQRLCTLRVPLGTTTERPMQSHLDVARRGRRAKEADHAAIPEEAAGVERQHTIDHRHTVDQTVGDGPVAGTCRPTVPVVLTYSRCWVGTSGIGLQANYERQIYWERCAYVENRLEGEGRKRCRRQHATPCCSHAMHKTSIP